MITRNLRNNLIFLALFTMFMIQNFSLPRAKEGTTKRQVEINGNSESLNLLQSVLEERSAQGSSPMHVVVLSSMGRSGSTLLAEMLSSIDKSVLFFEPLWLIRSDSCLKKEEQCREEYIKDIFTCDYSETFEKWLKSKQLFVKYFNSEAHDCMKAKKNSTSKKDCIRSFNMREACQNSEIRLLKVIRARVFWLRNFLTNPEINFKLIYLTRDPRGSITSINKFGPDWEKNPSILCGRLQQDMGAYNTFKELYPTKVLHISYEKLCLHPHEEVSRISQFLFGEPTISDGVENFINEHMTQGDRGGNMNTKKDSSKVFESWRWKIIESSLKSIEEEPSCIRSIDEMNHALFHSLDRVQNENISLFLN